MADVTPDPADEAAVKDVADAIATTFRVDVGVLNWTVEARAAIAAHRRHLTAERDAETTALRAELEEAESRLAQIWGLVQKTAGRGDDLPADANEQVLELTTWNSATPPAVLADPAPTPPPHRRTRRDRSQDLDDVVRPQGLRGLRCLQPRTRLRHPRPAPPHGQIRRVGPAWWQGLLPRPRCPVHPRGRPHPVTETLIPVPFTVTRYRCPLCTRTRSSKKSIGEHIARCGANPAAQSCKTCDHYDPGDNGCFNYSGLVCNCASGEDCRAGVDLADGLPINCPKWTEGDQT